MPMTKKIIGFHLSGPISDIHRQSLTDSDLYEEVTDASLIDELIKNAHTDGESFADYSDHYGTIYSGEMSFEIVDGVPMTVISYRFDDPVSDVNIEDDVITIDGEDKILSDLINEVIDETRGQLSDGIGEGFEQNPCYEPDDKWMYFISPGYPDMTVEYIYE